MMADGQVLNKDSLINYSYKIQAVNTTTNQHVDAGTGFLVKYDNFIFLVTNYHVVTGKYPVTTGNYKVGKLKDTANAIIVLFRDESNRNFNKLFMKLYDSVGERLFAIYHIDSVRLLDLAILPVFAEDLPPTTRIYSIDAGLIDSSYESNKPLYTVGFPFGEMANGWEPTLLSATSISEVNEDISFDSPSYSGMSGSPLYIQKENRLLLTGINYQSSILDGKVIGQGINIKFAVQLMRKMVEQDKINAELYLVR